MQRNTKTIKHKTYNEKQIEGLCRGRCGKSKAKERADRVAGAAGLAGRRQGAEQRRVAPPVEHGEPGQDATRHYLPSEALPPPSLLLPPSVSFSFHFLFPFPRSSLSLYFVLSRFHFISTLSLPFPILSTSFPNSIPPLLFRPFIPFHLPTLFLPLSLLPSRHS